MSTTDELLEAIFEGYDNDGLAVLVFGKDKRGRLAGQKLKVAKKFLPKDIKKGEIIKLELMSEPQFSRRRRHLTKAILEELLNN